MNKINHDFPAFPFEGGDNNGNQPYSGMTNREHFASLFMQAILTNGSYEAPRRLKFDGMAEDAVAAADALIDQLNR